jgi:predicted DNA binding CopG/RHH family protein
MPEWTEKERRGAVLIIEKLRGKAEKRGIGYQTMLKIIVHEHVDEY